MTHIKKEPGPPREWLKRAGEIEDHCRSLSVGGLASDLGMLRAGTADVQPVFGRLIEYARRKRGLSVEDLAEQAEVDLAAVVEIERNDRVLPEIRTVFQLAQVLDLPARRLMEVAGLASPKPEISNAALRFAAHSEPTARLSQDESRALEEFVKVLVETSDGAS
jgi:HTH-type transcriptional regulator, competence development regulator